MKNMKYVCILSPLLSYHPIENLRKKKTQTHPPWLGVFRSPAYLILTNYNFLHWRPEQLSLGYRIWA